MGRDAEARVAESLELESRLGVPPLICVNGKAAIHRNWQKGPFEEADLWRARLGRHRGNRGLVMGHGRVGVDLDVYKPEGAETFRRLTELGWLPTTAHQDTPSGGLHLLYSYDPELWHVGCGDFAAPRFPGGAEWKGTGGCLVVYGWDDAPVVPVHPELLAAVGSRLVDEVITGRHPRDLHPKTAETIRILEEHFGAHGRDIRHSIDGKPYAVLTRPGKADQDGISVSVGESTDGVAFFFTPNWPPFRMNQVVDLGALRDMTGMTGPRVTVKQAPSLPDGYRIWRPGDVSPAPQLSPAVRHGPIGEYLNLLEGNSEAHPGAVGALLLSHLGVAIGHQVEANIGAHRHPPVIWVAIVGPSSTGAKGTAEDDAERLLHAINPRFYNRHSLTGVGSGENLVRNVADLDPDSKGDPPEKDRLIADAELAAMFKVASREGSVLSEYLRKAYDSKLLRHSSNTAGKAVASARSYMVNIAGSITPIDLARVTTEADVGNGWLNRFGFVWAEAVDSLPRGGRRLDDKIAIIAADITAALAQGRSGLAVNGTRRLEPDDAFWELWEADYRKLRFPPGEGAESQLAGRYINHACRIALEYAVLDRSTSLGVSHLTAALGWVDYFRDTVARVFVRPSGDVGKLLVALRDAGEQGMSFTDQAQLFHRNRTADQLAEMRDHLVAKRLVVVVEDSSTQRPTGRMYAVTRLPGG